MEQSTLQKIHVFPSEQSYQEHKLQIGISDLALVPFELPSDALTKQQADGLYLSISGKAASATTADSSVKASQDSSGNEIISTYATKTELSDGLASKQPVGDYATNSSVTEKLATKVDNTTYTADKATFLTKTEASTTYLGKTQKASSAIVADSANSVAGTNVSGTVASATNANHATTADTSTSATKATRDGSGNVIVDTYATKPEVQQVVPRSELASQIIGFYNGLNNSNLDYRDYLDNDSSTLLEGFYDFGRGYIGE